MFRYEIFYYLWVKGFDIRRETQSFYAVFIIWPLSHAAPIARKSVSPLQARKVEPPRSASYFQLSNFLRNPPNPPRASISAYCDISKWHIRPARACVNTCINVAPKSHVLVLSLTKPKHMNRNPSAIILKCIYSFI